MTTTFSPKAVDEITYLRIVLDYILDESATTRTLAESYGISKSAVGAYILKVHVFDNKLDGLVRLKAHCNSTENRNKLRMNSKKAAKFKMKPALRAHLEKIRNDLNAWIALPSNISRFLWKDYHPYAKK